jgi:hypothetical protein
MLFKRFAHWLLFGLGVFVLAVLVLLGIETGVFGKEAQAWLRGQYAPLAPWYKEHHEALELAVKWIGGAFSAVFAVFAVYKSYYYAEFNLSERIVEFVQRTIKRAVRVRRPLISTLFGASTFEVLLPALASESSKRNLRAWMFVRRSKRAANDLLDSQKALDDEIRILAIRKRFCETQRITAHLVQGLQLSAEAALTHPNSEATLAKREGALAEFEKGLLLKDNDLDALQFAAREAKSMNDEPAALRFLTRMAVAAEAANEPVRHARALRFQAQIIDDRGTRKSWDEARPILVAARDLLEVAQNRLPEKILEFARVRELLGAVQIKREKFSAAGQELRKARSGYGSLSEPDRSEGIARVDKLLEKLTQSDDEPDDAAVPSALPVPLLATHVNPEEADVMNEGAAPIKLRAFTAVTVVGGEQGRVVIAKDGKILGRVEDSCLQKLN